MAWAQEWCSKQRRRIRDLIAGRFQSVNGKSRPLGAPLVRLVREESGAVVVLFALALIPIAGLMGLALDFARGQQARQQLQNAVDAAGLAVAQLPRDTPIANVEAKAKQWVSMSLAGMGLDQTKLQYLSVKATRKADGTGYTFEANLDVGLTLFRVASVSNGSSAPDAMRVSASNEVDWSLGNVEVALILDNTGSMAGTKLTNLKTAAKKLVDLLQQAQTKPGQVKISLVPFSQTVRLNPSYKDETWIDKGTSPINGEIFWQASPNRFDLLKALGMSWAGCVETRPQPYDVQETAADPAAPATLFVPFFAPDEPDSSSYSNDYLVDGITDTNWQKVQGNVAKYKKANLRKQNVPGPNEGCTLQTIIPLTDDFQGLKNAIDSMVAVGYTNIPLGMAWGWHTLSPYGPFKDNKGVPYGTPNVSKFAILMTDGENTFVDSSNKNHSYYQSLGYAWQNRLKLPTPLNSPYGSTTARTTKMDDRLKLLCANMKQPFDPARPNEHKVSIFALGVEVPKSVLDVLQNCADPGRFYDVQNSNDMSAVFTRIGEEIKQLRLAK